MTTFQPFSAALAFPAVLGGLGLGGGRHELGGLQRQGLLGG